MNVVQRWDKKGKVASSPPGRICSRIFNLVLHLLRNIYHIYGFRQVFPEPSIPLSDSGTSILLFFQRCWFSGCNNQCCSKAPANGPCVNIRFCHPNQGTFFTTSLVLIWLSVHRMSHFLRSICLSFLCLSHVLAAKSEYSKCSVLCCT